MKTALLLSGGVDSIAILYWLKPDVAITVDYGQLPADGEILASRAACDQTNTPHYVVQADCRGIGLGTMSKSTPAREQVTVPYPDRPEWWPYRNQLVVTLAAAQAIPLRIGRLLIGIVKGDQCHGDGSPDFVRAMNGVLMVQEGGVSLEAPAILLDALELVRHSGVPKSLLAWAHCCHTATVACGQCRGCLKHENILAELG